MSPLYGAQSPTVLYPGDQKYLFGTAPAGAMPQPSDANVVSEAIVAGDESVPVQLASMPGRVPGCMVQIVASADPGAAVFVIQESAIDTDGSYLVPSNPAYTLSTWTARGDGTYTVWSQLQPDSSVLLRLSRSAGGNNVNYKAKIAYV